MQLTRLHALCFLVLGVMCAGCPSSNAPPQKTRFSGTSSTVSRRGVQSIVVNGPACVIEIKDGTWRRAIPVSSPKGDTVKLDSVFDDDSSVRITALPPSPSPRAACDSYKPLAAEPFICMKCEGLSDSERTRYELEEGIPCCP